MKKLSGLKVGICQMSPEPGRPDRNSAFIISEIESASARGLDIIVFTEMCVTGYFIGDMLEDVYFLDDVLRANKRIVEATKSGITAIFGTVTISAGAGEDGRSRKHNTAVVASGGKVIGPVFGGSVKSLQPDYRFFNDGKHFYSLRQIAEERGVPLEDLLAPVVVKTAVGEIKLGVILCEDMWHTHYAHNPAEILVGKGAQMIINLSASPWTWQKNRKRHQIVQDLLESCRVPFIYANNTGVQNTGKNIIIFDGSSTIYNHKGQIVFEIQPHEAGTKDYVFSSNPAVLSIKSPDDTSELYVAMVAATKSVSPSQKTIVVGLSGGIDSAVVAAHLVDVLGPGRVRAVNMPFGDLNSRKTRDLAETVAKNLGISYEVIPITDIVESVCRATGIESGTLAHENVQARARKDILAALAQKVGGSYTCNTNKVEMAFGYGTLYGDVAGYYAPLGDLVKREVRQIADYLNRARFSREVIPPECIAQIPTAELALGQFDPFDYGGLDRRGYHDEMVRAFTEFRKNPEWFAELYARGTLERELMLETGTLARLFPTPDAFVRDLEKRWRDFQGAFFKRIQCPPFPVFSKRAFGRDLEESFMPAHFTDQYRYHAGKLIENRIFAKQGVAIYGGSFNPPGRHHEAIVKRLADIFDKVIIAPCGIRSDKSSTAIVSAQHRKAMIGPAFNGMKDVELDFSDLDSGKFTATYFLNEKYAKMFPGADLWFVVGNDLIEGGRSADSEIQRTWVRGEEIWRDLNFAVVEHTGASVARVDLPPRTRIISLPDAVLGRSTIIRERIGRGESINKMVSPEVVDYIKKNNLYKA